MIRIGRVTVWGIDPVPAGAICAKLVVENGKVAFGIWTAAAYTEGTLGYGVVYQRDPRYPSPLVNRRLT